MMIPPKLAFEVHTVPSIRTRMAQDIVPIDGHSGWLTKMGYLPGSEEGAAMEVIAGQERRNALAPISHSIDVFTQVASDLMIKAILLRQEKSIEDTSSLIPIDALMLANMAVTRSVIAQLLDFGILKISGYSVEGTFE